MTGTSIAGSQTERDIRANAHGTLAATGAADPTSGRVAYHGHDSGPGQRADAAAIQETDHTDIRPLLFLERQGKGFNNQNYPQSVPLLCFSKKLPHIMFSATVNRWALEIFMQIEYLSLFVDFSLSGLNEYLWNLISNYNFFGRLISHFT